MEIIVLVIIILVCFNFILKQTYYKKYSVVFSAAACALFVGLTWPYAILQSKSQISDWLADSELMLDIAVILTLEVAIQMAFCLLSVHIQSTDKLKPVTLWIYRILRWFPGLLIFPVLFSLLVTTIFALPGVSFSLVAWVLAAIIFVAIPLGRWFVLRLLPENEIRLELLFLSNALIAILGIIATVNGQTAVEGINEVDWSALAGIFTLLIFGLVAGIITYKLKIKRIIKKR
ncbi:MAG: hypothetical protein K5660_00900 [Paludibacteraceae bacterium]|nr:hypothetical protein [Paludibacteraceae bacterium]